MEVKQGTDGRRYKNEQYTAMRYFLEAGAIEASKIIRVSAKLSMSADRSKVENKSSCSFNNQADAQ